MNNSFFRKKLHIWCAAVCALACAVISCGRVGNCYIEAPLEKATAETARLHFFFDKTLSMRGFVEKGDESQYVKALPLLWQAVDTAFFSSSTHFYEYSTHSINELKSTDAVTYVKREALRPDFYSGVETEGVPVKTNNGQPFSSVADYIAALDEPGSAYIVVTDLYEQNRENPFFLFFRDAFSRGLSGAFFAVESSFTGSVHSVSGVNEEKSVFVRDGIAVFFVCIIGDSDTVYSYSAALAKELENKINFNSAVFMIDGAKDLELYHGEPVMAGSAKRFGGKENAFKQVNIRWEEISVITNLSPPPPVKIESYQLLTKTGSRFTAGLPLKNINPSSFNYKIEFSLSYFDGKTATAAGKEPSQFILKSNSTDVEARVFNISKIDEDSRSLIDTNYPLYVVIETKNREMKNGWYKISYRIISDAIPKPGWVSAINAENIKDLEESAKEKGGHVKVLGLEQFYEKIAGAYNNVRSRNNYSNELYLLKR
jgi:hypothetical protein